MKKILVLSLLCCALTSYSQLGVGVYLINGPFIVKSGTIFSSDGLVITPAADFDLTSAVPNKLERYSTVLPAHAVPQTYVSRVYRWGSTTPAYTGDVTIYYQLSELNGIPQNQLGLDVYGATGWTYYLPFLRDNVNLFVYTQSVPAMPLSELTLASMIAPLPVKWGAVSAERQSGLNAVVKWSTLDEDKVADYLVEKSADALQWTATGTSKTPYNTKGLHNYEITDEAGPAETFYRVRARDQSGAEHLSKVVFVQPLAESGNILVYPNPSGTYVFVATDKSTNTISRLSLFNAAGALVREINAGEVARFKLSLVGLPTGVYTIRIYTGDNKVNTTKIVKSGN